MMRSHSRAAVICAAVAIAALAAAIGLLESRSVFAHAGYDRSEPGRNEVLAAAPERVDVWFTQDVRKREGFYFVRVFDEQGAQASAGDGTVDDDDRRHMFATLSPDAGPGRYVVEWMTTSDIDGDDDEGSFCFYAGVEPTDEQAAECAVFDEDLPPTPTQRPMQPTAGGGHTPVSAVTITPAGTPAVAAPENGDSGDGSFPLAAAIAIIAGAVVLVGAAAAVWLRRS